MGNTGVLTKALAVGGTLLVWLPLVATIMFAVAGSLRDRALRVDYLMPAELSPIAFAGGGLLLWAALRARSRRALVGGGLSLALGLLVGGQALAVATGLASGEAEPVGWPWVLVITSLVAHTLAVVGVGTAGALLVRDAFRHGGNGGGSVAPPT